MQPHRSSALGYASAASAAHSRVYGACAAEAAASGTSGLSVGGCPERSTDFRPYPTRSKNTHGASGAPKNPGSVERHERRSCCPCVL